MCVCGKISWYILIMLLTLGISTSAYGGYGVCGDDLSKLPDDKILEVFKLIEKAGIEWIRVDFKWSEIEPVEGMYLFEKTDRLVYLALKHNIKVLGVFSTTPKWASVNNDTTSPPADFHKWERFVGDTVGHYLEKVDYWEIWNEPDIKKFWKGTPEEYLQLLKGAYRVIKRANPMMKVLSAGLDSNAERESVYLDKLLSLGMSDYTDIIAFHPYGRTPQRSLERVKTFLEIMERHGVKKPLWLTEVGWQTGGWVTVGVVVVKDEETKALYLKQTFQLLQPYAEVIFWYRAVETPKMFGLIEYDKKNGILKLTPSYDTFKEITQKEDK